MSRADTMQTQPVVNYIQGHALRDVQQRYSGWMHACGFRGHRLGEGSVKTAKRVLGKQDFCWTGYTRSWVWERPFTVTLEDGRVETWHWRLFASKRGKVLEVQDKYERPWGESIKTAAVAAVDDFLRVWNDNDPGLDDEMKALTALAKEHAK
jgi:hypothetical protein